MAFINFPSPTPIFPVLPPLAWSVRKKTIMASRIALAATGRSFQLACAVYPRWEFALTYGGSSWLRDQTQNITPDPTMNGLTELQQIAGLFLACKGSYGEFYYTDPDDSSRLGQAIATGDGITQTFSIVYSWGNGPFTPPMSMVPGGVNAVSAVYLNGVLATGYSLNLVNSTIGFTTAPGAGVAITMDFSFYYRCRFSDDTMKFSQFAQNRWEAKEVRFESVKV